MNATELYQQGKLQEAIEAQVQAVKNKPADQSVRLFLFELLAFAGELDRAQKQIDVLKYEDMELQTATMRYRVLLESEKLRRRFFAEGVVPKFPEDPPEHLKLRLDGNNQLRGGNVAAAKELFERADAAVPPLKGLLNGKPFDFIRDADDRFGPVLEVFASGNYFWVPFDQIEMVALNPPKFPRDLVWVPARLTTVTGTTGDVHLPVLYPNSHAHQDNQVKLGRFTDWTGEPGTVAGVGARVYLVGDDPVHLLEWRQLQFMHPAPPPGAGEAEAASEPKAEGPAAT